MGNRLDSHWHSPVRKTGNSSIRKRGIQDNLHVCLSRGRGWEKTPGEDLQLEYTEDMCWRGKMSPKKDIVYMKRNDENRKAWETRKEEGVRTAQSGTLRWTFWLESGWWTRDGSAAVIWVKGGGLHQSSGSEDGRVAVCREFGAKQKWKDSGMHPWLQCVQSHGWGCYS